MKKYLNGLLILLVSFFFLFTFSALSAETVKIGVLFPFTGSNALNGTDQFNGVEIAREMKNEEGGLWGKQIEFLRGDAVDANVSRGEAERLINVEGVKLIIGTFASGCCYTASEVAERNKVIYWEVNATSDELTARGFQYLFRVDVRASDYAKVSSDFIKEVICPKLGKEPNELRLVTLHEDSLYGVTHVGEFTKFAKQKGINVMEDISYNAGKTLDFSSIIMNLKKYNPDVIFASPYVPDFILFWSQAKQLNLNVPVFLGAGCIGESGVAEGLGDDVNYVFNAYLPTFCNPNALTEKSRNDLEEFTRRYEEKHGVNPPPILAVTGFAATRILFDNILSQVNSLDDSDEIRKVALATKLPAGSLPMGFGLDFDSTGHNIGAFAIIQQYQDNRIHVVWPEKYATRDLILPMPTWEEKASEKD